MYSIKLSNRTHKIQLVIENKLSINILQRLLKEKQTLITVVEENAFIIICSHGFHPSLILGW